MATKLFTPLTIREITFRNRVAVSPMCQYSSEDGFSSDWHLVHLGSRAVGGAALVFTEAAAVEPEGRISPQDLGIYKDEHIEGLQRITRFISEQGAVPGIQIAHAGRKASVAQPWAGGKPLSPAEGGWSPILGPSATSFGEGYQTPKEMSEAEIARVIAGFGEAAKRAFAAGFKVVEIHAAHGYLINEFLSPLSNFRTDSYGGSFENRIRFLREIVLSVRQNWPDQLPLFIRLSVTDWKEEGWGVSDSIALASLLKGMSVDLIDCSSGGNAADARIPIGPGYQTPFADALRKEAKILTGAVGLITSPEQAEHIITTEQADIVLLAREMLRDPYWPRRAAKALNAEIKVPPQYQRSW